MRSQVLSLFCTGFSAVACVLALLLFAPHSPAQDLKFSQISSTSGAPGTLITITGEKFGTSYEACSVKFGGAAAKVKYLSDNEILVFVPPSSTSDPVDVVLTINKVKAENLGPFTIRSSSQSASKPAPAAKQTNKVAAVPHPSNPQTAASVQPVTPPSTAAPQQDTNNQPSGPTAAPTTPSIAKIDPPSGAAESTVTITGTGFGKSQGTVTIGGQRADLAKDGWKDTEIDVSAPDLKVTADTDETVVIQDDSGKTIGTGTFKETLLASSSPVIASIIPFEGVAGTPVTINGSGFGDTQGKSTVTIGNLPATVASTKGWSDNQIIVTAPDLSQSRDLERKNCSDVTKPKSSQSKGLDMKNCIEAAVSVSVAGTDKKTAAKMASGSFVETPPQWSDKDEKPFGIRFVGGYEQGYQSAGAGVSDAFLAVYGRALYFKDTVGPFYQIRLQTAPQASGTNGVVSVLTNPSGSITAQNLQTVGSAVDLSLGFEYQVRQWSHYKQNTLGIIAGGGFVTPLQANSVNVSFVMPAFGTVECTVLQSRLSSVLSNPIYTGITPTTSSTTPATTSCYTNKITSTPTNVTTLNYDAPNQPNFFPKYFVGLRSVSRFPGVTGLKQCDQNNPCERGYVDFMLGQDANISGGTLKHLVATVDSIYPLPVPSVNFLYLFGSTSLRLHNLPPALSPLVLLNSPTTGSSTPPTVPNAAVLVLPMTQPDRDFYRIGIGVNLNQIFTALTKPKTVTP